MVFPDTFLLTLMHQLITYAKLEKTSNKQKSKREFNSNNTSLHTNIISWCSAFLTSGNRWIISSSSQLRYIHLC